MISSRITLQKKDIGDVNWRAPFSVVAGDTRAAAADARLVSWGVSRFSMPPPLSVAAAAAAAASVASAATRRTFGSDL